MKYHVVFCLLAAFFYMNVLKTSSSIDNLAFGFKDIIEMHENEDCADAKKIFFNIGDNVDVLQQENQKSCGFHALKNAVIFLDDEKNFTDKVIYEKYYNEWKSYAQNGSLDNSMETCISEKLKSKADSIVVLSELFLNNNNEAVISGTIKEIKVLYNLINQLRVKNPKNFVFLVGLQDEHGIVGHWIAVFVDISSHQLIIADSNGGDYKKDPRVMYIKNMLEQGACLYLQDFFTNYVSYMKEDSHTLTSLERKVERIDKDLLKKLESSSPKFYIDFQKKVENLKNKLSKK